MKIYLVGGAVRDTVMGLAPKDHDYVVVGATTADMIEDGFRPVGADFPVFLHPDTGDEYALARTERSDGEGHKAFVCETADVSLAADLSRRDLTINAMAQDEDEGAIIDPFGGQADIAARVLRHVSSAFADDPLRVLRVARFAARFGFDVAPETADLCRSMVGRGDIDSLTPERIWIEAEKALNAPHPSRFFAVLREFGALDVIFPEIAALDVPQPPIHHPEGDALTHTMMVVDVATQTTDCPVTRFAALVHDLGKGATPTDILPSHHGHEEAGVVLVDALCARLKIPNAYRDAGRQASQYHTLIHRARVIRPSKLVKLFVALRAFHDRAALDRLLAVADADARGRGPTRVDVPYPNLDFVREAFDAARQVKPRKGLRGVAVGNAMLQDRAAAIKAAL